MNLINLLSPNNYHRAETDVWTYNLHLTELTFLESLRAWGRGSVANIHKALTWHPING